VVDKTYVRLSGSAGGDSGRAERLRVGKEIFPCCFLIVNRLPFAETLSAAK